MGVARLLHFLSPLFFTSARVLALDAGHLVAQVVAADELLPTEVVVAAEVASGWGFCSM